MMSELNAIQDFMSWNGFSRKLANVQIHFALENNEQKLFLSCKDKTPERRNTKAPWSTNFDVLAAVNPTLANRSLPGCLYTRLKEHSSRENSEIYIRTH